MEGKISSFRPNEQTNEEKVEEIETMVIGEKMVPVFFYL